MGSVGASRCRLRPRGPAVCPTKSPARWGTPPATQADGCRAPTIVLRRNAGTTIVISLQWGRVVRVALATGQHSNRRHEDRHGHRSRSRLVRRCGSRRRRPAGQGMCRESTGPALLAGADRHPRAQPARRPPAVDRCDRCREAGELARDARDRPEEPLRVHRRAGLPRAQGRARHRGVRRHRSEPHRRWHQPGGCRAHDAGHGRVGTLRLDADVRRREPGALFEGEPAVCQRVAATASCCRRSSR